MTFLQVKENFLLPFHWIISSISNSFPFSEKYSEENWLMVILLPHLCIGLINCVVCNPNTGMVQTNYLGVNHVLF